MSFPRMVGYTQPISGLPPQGGPEVHLQAIFQQCFDEIMNSLNNLAQSLEENTAAENIGAIAPEGYEGSTVQLLINAIANALNTHKADKNNPHAVTAAQVGAYSKAELDPYLRGGDTVIKIETFTIINSNNGDGTFTYSDVDNVQHIGSLDEYGNQIFTLLKGVYETGQNRIECFINDTLHRSAASGGLEEMGPTLIKLTDPQGAGAEITFKYFEKIGVVGTGLIVMSNSPGPYYWIHD